MIHSSSFTFIFLLCFCTLAALISVVNYYLLISGHRLTLSTVNQSIGSKQLCMQGVFQRIKSDESITDPSALTDLLTDGEDVQQQHRACRLHHYKFSDVVRCLDRLGPAVRADRTKLLHFAFVGDSTIREQYDSFRQVFTN